MAVMVEMRRQQQEDEQRKRELGLSDEELAFYDVVALGAEVGLPTDNEWIAGLVHEVVAAVKRNLAVDWTRTEQAMSMPASRVRWAACRDAEALEAKRSSSCAAGLTVQAEAMYEEWPMVA